MGRLKLLPYGVLYPWLPPVDTSIFLTREIGRHFAKEFLLPSHHLGRHRPAIANPPHAQVLTPPPIPSGKVDFEIEIEVLAMMRQSEARHLREAGHHVSNVIAHIFAANVEGPTR